MKKLLFSTLLGMGAIIFCSFNLPSSFSFFTNNNTITEIEESSFYYILDNRFKGGSDAFLELFDKRVKYPQDAMDNCRVGLSKIKFTITKDGAFQDLDFSNPLEFGIEKELESFFNSIKGNWKSWARESVMEMTVGWAFVTSRDSYYPDADLVIKRVPTYKWSSGNWSCAADAINDKKIKKYLKKKKYDKALPYVEEMLRRYPDNAEYIDNKKFIGIKLK